jgi:hypothetical protein
MDRKVHALVMLRVWGTWGLVWALPAQLQELDVFDVEVGWKPGWGKLMEQMTQVLEAARLEL